MKLLRSFCLFFNIVLLIIVSIAVSHFIDCNWINEWHEWAFAVLGVITPLATCYYFMNDDSEKKDDSLLGLWLKVKKKKLKDQLSPNDD